VDDVVGECGIADGGGQRFGELQEFGLNVGWNATGKCVESQPHCEDILQGSVVEIAGNALGEINDTHIEEKYVPLLV